METRLEILEPSFAKKLKYIDPSKRRDSAFKIAQFALDRADVKNELVARIVRELRAGNFIKASNMKASLEALLDDLEEIQLTVRKDVNSGQVSKQAFVEVYNQARAVNALLFALDPDSYIAITEAAYEAYSITQDLTDLNHILFN